MDEIRIKLAVWEAILNAQKKSGDKITKETLLNAITAGIAEYDRMKNNSKE